jgi:S-adenosylmethionine-diacylglycerol 3-amino-3-carboxypropyl transferase
MRQAHIIDNAVVRNDAPKRERLADRAFALAFRGLVYAQIWEDPVVDMAALDIQPDSRIVTIATDRAMRCPIWWRTLRRLPRLTSTPRILRWAI